MNKTGIIPRITALTLTATLAAAVAPPVGAQAAEPDVEPVAGAAGQSILVREERVQIAPGATLTTFTRLYARGWVRGYLLTADLTDASISPDLIDPGTVTAAEPLTKMAERAGAVAAVNGDFFDIRNTKLPLGFAVGGGQVLKSGPVDWAAAGIGADRLGRVAAVTLESTITLPWAVRHLAAVNQYTVPGNGIGLYTSAWGGAPRSGAAFGAARAVEVTVRDGKVVSLSDKPGSGLVPGGTYVLVGRELGVDALAGLKVGDPVGISFSARQEPGSPLRFAVGGNVTLAKDGQLFANLDDRETGPRTALGFSADGRRIYLLTVDGRQEGSRGLTIREMGEMMLALGATQAINLDGGGSTTMVARRAGETSLSLIGHPSDGAQRSVANGVGLFAAKGSGQATGITVAPTLSVEHADRLFPGTVTSLTARAHDEMFGPAQSGPLTWSLAPGQGEAGAGTAVDGLFIGKAPGPVTVTASAANGATGSVHLRVLGELDHLRAEPQQISLTTGETARFRITGYDADGYAAPVDPMNISLAYDGAMVAITSAPDGSFVLKGLKDGPTLVRVHARSKEVLLPVTVGMQVMGVPAFDRLGAWAFDRYPAAVKGGLSQGGGQGGGPVIKLTYDFTGATGTRAAYVQQYPGLTLPGEPTRLALWVKGDGKGAWLRAALADAAGNSYLVTLAQHVSWVGWRYVLADLPAGAQYPLRLTRVYPVETVATQKYDGELMFAGLEVHQPFRVDVPSAPAAPDPMVSHAPEWELGRWKFAVVPVLTTAAVQGARGAGAEFLLAGDCTDGTASGSVAPVPIYCADGPQRTLDVHGTRFVLLESGTGSFRTADFAGLANLKAQLDDAAKRTAVQNVVVITRQGAGELGDPAEVRLVESWLSDFRAGSGGKGAAFVGGTGTAGVVRAEGVPFITPGSWGLFGVAPGPGTNWLKVDVTR
jgi:hypothetical protein